MKHNHDINIAGVPLPLSSDNDERYVQILAAELTRRIGNMTNGQTSITKLEAALVCALDLLDENCRLKLELEDLKKGAE
jgi:cell division protein ZapA (FtsZ GTPase activity inhibitor)